MRRDLPHKLLQDALYEQDKTKKRIEEYIKSPINVDRKDKIIKELRSLATKYGYRYANDIIKSLHLNGFYGIIPFNNMD